MKKHTFITTAFILLLFVISCTKTKSGLGNENDRLPEIAFQFILIDKDGDNLYKYPNILNTKYDPHQLYAVGQDGDTMKKIYLSYKADTTSIQCNIDTLKNNNDFWIVLYDPTINVNGNNIYYLHYNNDDTDTLLVNINKNYNEGGYFECNNIPIYKYSGSKNYKGSLLFIK